MIRPSQSEADTLAIAHALAARLTPGTVLLLRGDLGAGKTAFVRGLAHGLGVAPEEVSSPTFTLIQEYRGGRLPLYHVDLYRLSPAEVDDLGLDDLICEGGVVAIEWPERWTHAPADAVAIEIRSTGETGREIRITSAPDAPA